LARTLLALPLLFLLAAAPVLPRPSRPACPADEISRLTEEAAHRRRPEGSCCRRTRFEVAKDSTHSWDALHYRARRQGQRARAVHPGHGHDHARRARLRARPMIDFDGGRLHDLRRARERANARTNWSERRPEAAMVPICEAATAGAQPRRPADDRRRLQQRATAGSTTTRATTTRSSSPTTPSTGGRAGTSPRTRPRSTSTRPCPTRTPACRTAC
jgi:hypothetical protein